MEQRLSLVTLEVSDLARAKRFCQGLGWRGQEVQETVFHVWEIAHNPGFPTTEDGSITVPDFGA